ncbi:MAG TPA: DUF1800 domain-containing protein [Gammaproteobacteria bacterium]|nr:DUF1800 domain-containing protein [Gammaproteobacteria bacterium]
MILKNTWSPGQAAWQDDLSPLPRSEWSYDRAAHLLAHAGFGGTPEEIRRLADLGLERAVAHLVHYERVANPKLTPFVESGLWDPTLTGFPDSRPEATDRAERHGESMGVSTKPAGNRPVQPVSDRFFYWLRATMLETRRLGYWWANRMVATTHPLEEKMALFWHGHFATHENKVRDYRKMLQQIELFERYATGNVRDLTLKVAQTPAMLYFLDAQYNVKGAPNENFAREVMELFTMGVGNYTEKDVRECARAFTGWYFDDLAFHVDPAKHDAGAKDFLGRRGNFDGADVIEIIFEQPVTAEFLAGKIYRFLVREELSPQLRKSLGAVLRSADYDVKALLTAIFTSKDFYSAASYGGHIKSPVEHMIAMMRQLGSATVPGVPDFNQSTIAMGQHLLNPPSVAGWAGGKAWITPGLLIARGNVARDVLIPDMTGFRDWNFTAGTDDVLGQRLRDGYDIGAATAVSDPATMSTFDRVALERDERFNTRISGYIGWEQAARKLIPTPRDAARFDLTALVLGSGAKTAADAVDHLATRLLRVPLASATREAFVAFLTKEIGTEDLERARSYLEDPLRMTAHLVMSTPEYQIV